MYVFMYVRREGRCEGRKNVDEFAFFWLREIDAIGEGGGAAVYTTAYTATDV